MQGVCQTGIIMLFAQELLIHITKQCDPEWFLRMVVGSWAISRKVVEACVEDSSTIFQNLQPFAHNTRLDIYLSDQFPAVFYVT